MNNPRITAKERNLIKGAIRRAFARSDLHQQVMNAATIEYSDPKRPRCKKWIRCPVCLNPSPRWQASVDHIDPVVPLEKTFTDMSADELIDRMWCDISNLQAICKPCHDEKTTRDRIAKEDYQISIGVRKPRKVKKPKKDKKTNVLDDNIKHG